MTKASDKSTFNLKGRGILDGLVSDQVNESKADEQSESAARWIPIEQIQAGSVQPRQFFSAASINSLSETFQVNGFKGAINVRRVKGDNYEIVAGERRWRAAKLAGLEKVRCIIDEYNDDEALEFALVENLQREDLSKLEETEGILQLIEFKLEIPKDKAVSIVRSEGHTDRLTRSDVAPSQEITQITSLLSYFNIELQTFRTKNLRTLSLPEDLKIAHLQQSLSYSSALELSKIKDPEKRSSLLEETLDNNLSFRSIKKKVKDLLNVSTKEVNPFASQVEQIETKLKQAKKSKDILIKPQKRKRLERILKDLTALLDEED